MKRFIFPVVLLLIVFPTLKLPEIKDRSFFATYADSQYLKKEVNFSPGQSVFVKVTLASSTSASGVLTILDQEKSQVKKVFLEQKGQEFVGKVSTPLLSGTYYVHVEIKGEGLAFSGERNITVIGSAAEENKAPVRSEAKSIVSTSEKPLPIINKKAVFGDFLSLIRTWISRFLGNFTKAS